MTSCEPHAASHAPERSGGPLRRRYARPAVLLAVTGVSLYLLLPSLVAVFSSWRSLSHLNWYWTGVALLSEAASYICLWELDRISLHESSWFTVACTQLSGNSVGRIIPGGGATATAFAVGMLRRAGVDVGRAAAALTASTLLQIATRLALPVLALPAIIGGAPVSRSLVTSAFLGLLVLLFLDVAGILAFTSDRSLLLAGRGLQWVVNRTIRRRGKVEELPKQLLSERDFVRHTIGERWKAAVLTTAATTGFDYIALLCALRAVGAQPHPSLVLLAYAGTQLLALIPFTPGGLGFVEAGLVGTLTLADVAPQDALVATLLYRLVSYWLPIPAGAVAYLIFRRRYP